ncbi:MAG TPA: glyoxylate/hydroxypyruvate reductase A [Afifellaceae bacterium]|nr:glyoxylate/hydroxypyruvate reductase A [Afifellaceae bacterium]
MAVLVAVDRWDPEPWAKRLRRLLPGRTVLTTDGDGQFAGDDAELAAVRYALVWKPRPELLARLANLEVLFSLGAGVDHILSLPQLPAVPIVRIVDPDLTGRMVEYVVWQVLHHHRRGPEYARQQAERHWRERRQPAAREVTVGIMGLGVLGQAAAEAVARLGFRLAGWSRSEKQLRDMACFHGEAGLGPFLAQTDILVTLLPLTPETSGILNYKLFAQLKRGGPLGGAVIINAGRGGSQVEADIVVALEDGTLKSASLDVFETEPLPADSPLWVRSDVVITPHNAAVSDPEALTRQIAEQIAAYERGEPLQNLVDTRRGY